MPDRPALWPGTAFTHKKYVSTTKSNDQQHGARPVILKVSLFLFAYQIDKAFIQ
jgi:hypothetical protein